MALSQRGAGQREALSAYTRIKIVPTLKVPTGFKKEWMNL